MSSELNVILGPHSSPFLCPQGAANLGRAPGELRPPSVRAGIRKGAGGGCSSPSLPTLGKALV